MKPRSPSPRAPVVASSILALALLSACGGSSGTGGTGGGSGDWYYHWSCNGDSECLATNPTGQASGTLDEGPVQVNCTQLMEFASRFWGAAATNSCDHAATAGGGSTGTDGGTGGSGLTGPPTIGYVTPGGAPGTVVSIAGSNFPTSASAVTVSICGATATVTAATATNLNVTVPKLSAGTCTPLTVTTALGTATWSGQFQVTNAHLPFALVVDASSVYWTEQEQGGSVKKVGLNGGAVTVLATGLGEPMFLAQDASSVYWAEYGSGTIKRVAKGGGAVTTLATGLQQPYAIAVDSTSVYFTENVGSTALKKVAKTGTGPVAPSVVANDVSAPNAIAVNGSGIYYFGPGNQLSRVGLGGGAGTPLTAVGDQGVAIAVDATQVYWGYRDFHRVPLAGGTASSYGLPYSQYDALVVDATSLYFADGYGNVSSVPLGGGTATPTTLAAASGALLGLAVDSTSVYWTDSTTASVKKVAKTGGTVTVLATSPNVP